MRLRAGGGASKVADMRGDVCIAVIASETAAYTRFTRRPSTRKLTRKG